MKFNWLGDWWHKESMQIIKKSSDINSEESSKQLCDM